MQLMTFNSLLMFDIVFVFFLFLVGVTCLVYYLPTGSGGGGNNKPQQHNHPHYVHHDHETVGEATGCRYERHRLHHACPHHRISQLHQIHYATGVQAAEVETEGTETETESELGNYREQPRSGEHQHLPEERLLIPVPPCRCSLSTACTACDLPPRGNRPGSGNCVLTLEREDRRRASTVDLRLLERHPTPHHRYCHRHSVVRETDRCLHYVEDDDPENESSDEIFYCNDDSVSGMGVNGFRGLLSPLSPHIEHVVVNETESAAGSRQSAVPLTAPQQCCYIKAKFMDVKECVGPIADV